MDETFTFRNFILCEDIRTEINGKQILIGAYAGVILAESLPTFWPLFAMRVEVNPKKDAYESVQLKIEKPNGTVLSIFDIAGVKIRDVAYPAALVFHRSPMVFDMEGDYAVSLAMDCKPINIGSFTVVIRKPTVASPPTAAPVGRRRRASPSRSV
jgi:hypothetical protein